MEDIVVGRQLTMDFETGNLVYAEPEEKPRKTCKHTAKVKSFKKDYISYCSKCGKILSVRRKKED